MKSILIIVDVVLAIGVLTILMSRYQFNKKVENEIKKLNKQVGKVPTKIFTYNDIKSEPEPVQRYFKYVLKEGQHYINFVRLEHSGYFRTGEKQNWSPIEGEQYYLTEHPSFIWFARLNLAPLLWVKARDRYVNGKGNILVKLLSTITIANAKGKKIDQSTLIRFLSEAPWFPTALLPGNYLTWEEIDSHSAKATVKDRGIKASVVFYFNNKGEITHLVTNDRFKDTKKEKWTTYYRKYREINGVMIPIEGEAVWNLKSGDFSYAKFNITEIKYNKAVKEDVH